MAAIRGYPFRIEGKMRFDKAYVPYGVYWSSPFCKWQGSIANVHAMEAAAQVAKQALEERKINAEVFDGLALGLTIPQHHCFYGAPWLAAMIGAPHITGPTIAQACATSARALVWAAQEVEDGSHQKVLVATADRCSNGPHIYYPNPNGPGGTGAKEDWVLDNFGFDPYAKNAMIQTAENVAAEEQVSREEQDACALMRYEQYQMALANDRAFQKRFMVGLELRRGKKVLGLVDADEGVAPTTAEGLAKLRPVLPEGTVTFGSQTHPADGNAALAVTSREQARELSRDAAVEIRVVSFGQTRAKKGFMAAAVTPAAQQALDRAGWKVEDLAAVKTHNPFAVNDVVMAKKMGIDHKIMNNYGSSLVYGHPQGPTGLRIIIELLEELVEKGGGRGLFAGCAAGDTAFATTFEVSSSR
jgi:acetyl-CoA acetyltransferase family protein